MVSGVNTWGIPDAGRGLTSLKGGLELGRLVIQYNLKHVLDLG